MLGSHLHNRTAMPLIKYNRKPDTDVEQTFVNAVVQLGPDIHLSSVSSRNQWSREVHGADMKLDLLSRYCRLAERRTEDG